MEAQFLSGNPRTVKYTPSGSDIAAGQVVLVDDLALVAHLDITDGDLGTLSAGGGVYRVAKTSGATITGGERLWWNDTLNVVQTGNTGKVFGYAVPAGASSSATTCDVLHDPTMDNAGT